MRLNQQAEFSNEKLTPAQLKTLEGLRRWASDTASPAEIDEAMSHLRELIISGEGQRVALSVSDILDGGNTISTQVREDVLSLLSSGDSGGLRQRLLSETVPSKTIH